MNIAMLVYPGMTLLDLVGPLQAWSLWPGASIQTVAGSREPVPTDSAAVLVPTQDFDGAFEAPDILFAPGGTAGTFAAMQDEATLAWLRDRGARSGWITSVCTGALVLGAAGLLDGYRATTHWAALDLLPQFGATVVRERWVIDRNRATGGGVTAGIDFGLALMAELAGDDIARQTQLALEYAPAPPFEAGTPDQAGPELTRAVLEGFARASAAEQP